MKDFCQTPWDLDKLIKCTFTIRQPIRTPESPEVQFEEWEEYIETIRNRALNLLYERKLLEVDDSNTMLGILIGTGWCPLDKFCAAQYEHNGHIFKKQFPEVEVTSITEVVDKVEFGI